MVLRLGLEEGSWCPVLTMPGHPEGVGAEESQLAAGGDDVANFLFSCQIAQPGEG